MSFTIDYLATVVDEDIPQLPKTMRLRIKKASEDRLMVDPVAYGKPLQYSLTGHRRIRIGDYRVIYRIEVTAQRVLIVAIKHRKDVYE